MINPLRRLVLITFLNFNCQKINLLLRYNRLLSLNLDQGSSPINDRCCASQASKKDPPD